MGFFFCKRRHVQSHLGLDECPTYFNCLIDIVKNHKTNSSVQLHGVLKRKAARQFFTHFQVFYKLNQPIHRTDCLQPFPSVSIFLHFNFKASVVVKTYIHKIYTVTCHFYKVFGCKSANNSVLYRLCLQKTLLYPVL